MRRVGGDSVVARRHHDVGDVGRGVKLARVVDSYLTKEEIMPIDHQVKAGHE
jgi:hypothetical protein